MHEYELYHHGIKGQKWGVRRDKYLARMARNQSKIDKLDKKLHTTGAMKRKARAAKAQAKLDKYERKAAKARLRLAKGKNISRRQEKAIMKSEKYKAKVAANSAKNDKWESGIAKLEKKNTRLQKKVDRLNKKMANEQLNSPSTQKKIEAGKDAVSINPRIQAAWNKSFRELSNAIESKDSKRINKAADEWIKAKEAWGDDWEKKYYKNNK